jgi:1-acyl-sn-glycerol-3-phosphate acyltransferase
MFEARDAPRAYRIAQHPVWWLLRHGGRLSVAGIERVPQSGPVLVASNHLHTLDAILVACTIPRYQAVLAAEKWRGTVAGLIMEAVTHVIYIERGSPDRRALESAVGWLRAGGALALAPEGTRSRKGVLQRGKPGAAYLASRAGATVVPVAMWGQEHALGDLGRLRRPQLNVAIGEPIVPPEALAHARTADLMAFTDQIMASIARLLPESYRGAYSDAGASGSGGGTR